MNTHHNQCKIIEAIKSGMPYRAIQDKYSCSNVMITYQKRRLGIPINSPDRSKETDEEIKKLLAQGKKYKEIIEIVGTHSQRILKVSKGTRVKPRKEESFNGWY